MGYTVTSWFNSQAAAPAPPVKRVFTLGNSDYSARVGTWPVLRRDVNDIRPVSLTIDLANEDQAMNLFRTNKSLMKTTGTLKMGFTHPTSGDELLTLFQGTIERVAYKDGKCELSFMDTLKDFTERVVGDTSSPALFTDTGYLPSDIAWVLCTSYGGKSAVASTNNPDINYADFLTWAQVFSENSVYVKARFEGIKVVEALRKIARYTDSGIFVEGDNKISFVRFGATNSLSGSLDNSSIKNLGLVIDDTKIVNKHYVFADYDVNSSYWKINALSVDSSSVNSFGAREFVEKDESVWYVNSSSALNLAQRRTSFGANAFEEYEVDTTLTTLPRQIGETLYLADALLSVNSSSAWRIMGYELDTDQGAMKLKASNERVLTPFTLDDATLGLLDQSYNPLL